MKMKCTICGSTNLVAGYTDPQYGHMISVEYSPADEKWHDTNDPNVTRYLNSSDIQCRDCEYLNANPFN